MASSNYWNNLLLPYLLVGRDSWGFCEVYQYWCHNEYSYLQKKEKKFFVFDWFRFAAFKTSGHHFSFTSHPEVIFSRAICQRNKKKIEIETVIELIILVTLTISNFKKSPLLFSFSCIILLHFSAKLLIWSLKNHYTTLKRGFYVNKA